MLNHLDGFQTGGKLRSVQNVLSARLVASVGELCEIPLASKQDAMTSKSEPRRRRPGTSDCLLGEVIGIHQDEVQIMTFQHPHGLQLGMDVFATRNRIRIPVGSCVLGRTLNGLGQPIDRGAPLIACRYSSASDQAPDALTRRPIQECLVTGQRVIDGLLTLGRGQRMGLFAGSGVGKSTLMGEIAKHARADLNVIVLVGERGREVRPFIDDCLGDLGKRRSVVIVATSNETPLMRIQAAKTGVAIAEDFRSQGASVFFFLDSLTRLAHAQRELGLSRGEPPGTRGYPPSVYNLMANILERLGNDDRGSITGIITVLVDGDDLDEPIADAARSILDGHIVLDRKLADMGHFPAVNVLQSVSRLFREVTSAEHQRAVSEIRTTLAVYEEVKDLVQVGLYQPGASPRVDEALRIMPSIEAFLKQKPEEHSALEETLTQLMSLAV